MEKAPKPEKKRLDYGKVLEEIERLAEISLDKNDLPPRKHKGRGEPQPLTKDNPEKLPDDESGWIGE